MIKTTFAILLCMLSAVASGEEAKISSFAIGVYRPDEKELLAPAFINAVNRYLQRYEPRLKERSTAHVFFMVNYDFEYAIELRVGDREYEVTVTLKEKTSSHSRAQKKAAKLTAGVHKTMEDFLIRSARARG